MRFIQYYASFKWHSWKFWLLKYFWLLSVYINLFTYISGYILCKKASYYKIFLPFNNPNYENSLFNRFIPINK